jgi:hypothetical protein
LACERRSLTVAGVARDVITLFKNANASTFLHETAHDWLERLMRDAKDRDAPDQMRRDSETVRRFHPRPRPQQGEIAMPIPWRVEMFNSADAKWVPEGGNYRSAKAATIALTKLRAADANRPGPQRRAYRVRRAG